MVMSSYAIEVQITTKNGGKRVQVNVATEKAAQIYREVYEVASRHMSGNHANDTASYAVSEYIYDLEEIEEEQHEQTRGAEEPAQQS